MKYCAAPSRLTRRGKAKICTGSKNLQPKLCTKYSDNTELCAGTISQVINTNEKFKLITVFAHSHQVRPWQAFLFLVALVQVNPVSQNHIKSKILLACYERTWREGTGRLQHFSYSLIGA